MGRFCLNSILLLKLVCFFRELFNDFPILEKISENNKFHFSQPLLFRSIITVKIKLGNYSFQKKGRKGKHLTLYDNDKAYLFFQIRSPYVTLTVSFYFVFLKSIYDSVYQMIQSRWVAQC